MKVTRMYRYRDFAVAVSLAGICSSCMPSSKPAPKEPGRAELEAWRRAVLKTPRPANGCVTATFPEQKWNEAACQTPPLHTKVFPPKRPGTTRSTIVGGAGPDFSAIGSGHITVAEGSFDPGSSVASECSVPCPSQVCPTSPSCAGRPANNFSLQLNSKTFMTSTCGASPTPTACLGWEQFVYESGGGGFIQYWLEHYGPAGTLCPTPRGAFCVPGSSENDGWCPFSFTPGGEVYCVVNAAARSMAPPTTAPSLPTVSITGAAAGMGGSATDSMAVTVGTTLYPANGSNYFPDLGSQWQEVEFNVFGDGSGDQAVFNTGATLVVRTAADNGSSAGPTCDLHSFTGESNNLTLVNMPPAAAPGPMPALVFSETNPGPGSGVASCADATSIGDTHLTTFSGLLYDFQATGDFLLAETGSGFVVQSRQVSGAPTWPNAAVNTAVGARVGSHTVAVCLPGRLEVDGRPARVEEGGSLTLPDGVGIERTGNVYLVTDEAGDSLRAELNDGWIGVAVGLGHWPTKVRGLLANPDGNVKELATSAGAVLAEPVSFEVLYGQYGESWRVKDGASFLCKDEKLERGNPAKPFFAKDLEPQLAERARAICLKAGVKGPHLDACTLDVAVIGKETAARAFVDARPPVLIAPL